MVLCDCYGEGRAHVAGQTSFDYKSSRNVIILISYPTVVIAYNELSYILLLVYFRIFHIIRMC